MKEDEAPPPDLSIGLRRHRVHDDQLGSCDVSKGWRPRPQFNPFGKIPEFEFYAARVFAAEAVAAEQTSKEE